MENNSNNRSAQGGNNSSASGNMNSNQSAQGKSNQQATSGKDSVKNIQDMLQQYSGPIAKKINGLTTTQKIVGGSLLALGAGWIAMNSGNKEKLRSKANDLTSTAKNKANDLSSTAKQKMNENKGSNSNDNAANRNSSGSNASRTGSSAVDARVK
ncbi:hypothetical protein DXT99_16500 [Pontibacter diazotrophicus]|uniref:Uncharacterized protein n=1 Tax=Pontibacter diazotrophicus TaxID=1400979 RepID=A0A3D8L9Z0_9BACT|nr:hypothetical protein [Pontibacter diazotrophicus]RDV14163.1 hypothetical protein DXT99_16500 [Pontibacter diazotrophicus]